MSNPPVHPERVVAPESDDGRLARARRIAGVAVGYAVLVAILHVAANAQMLGVAAVPAFPVSLAVAALAWGAARTGAARGVASHVTRLWTGIAIGYAAMTLGNLTSVFRLALPHSDEWLLASAVPYAAFFPCVLWGMLGAPRGMRTTRERIRLWLDAITVVVAGAMVCWYFVLHPDAPSSTAPAIIVAAVFFPLGYVALVVAGWSLLQRERDPAARGSLAVLVSSQLLQLGSVLALGHTYVASGALGGGWVDATMQFGDAGIVLAAFFQYRLASRPSSVAPMARHADRTITAMPYLAVGAGFLLLLTVEVRQWTDPVGGLVIGAAVLTALVIARQLVAVRETSVVLAEHAAREGEARFRALVQHSSDVITILEVDGTIRYVSPSVERMLGQEADDVVGTRLTELIHPTDIPKALAAFGDVSRAVGPSTPITWRLRGADGAWIHVENIATNLLEEPTVAGVVLNTRDVTDRKALEEQLTHQAFHDPLTNLANRALFRDRVEHALSRINRDPRTVAVLFLDLDNFKTINDSFGHAAGDRLLVAAAERLQACLRASDTAARLGGDEFAVLIEDAPNAETVTQVAERIAAALTRPFLMGEGEMFVNASIGIAYTEAGENADELLRNADVAMYTAKSRGKGLYAIFEQSMHVAVLERLELEADLRRAVEREELAVHYQSIVDLRTGKVTGVEALCRWSHPRRGFVPPSVFIPIAEESGLIVPIGRWVLHRACWQARQWQLQYPGEVPLTVTVNMSARQVQQPGLVTEVADALRDSGLPADNLVVELTESVLMANTEQTLDRLQDLRMLGVQLAIDDFGTGYSSLSYLQRFPIDVLKIAKAFVDRIGSAGDDPALARVIIALGRTLRLRTVAEGIENGQQLAILRQLGCELGQGYFFAKPLSRDDASEYLRAAALKTIDNREPSED
ncbi:MAG: EAL domain-containing protein [Gemmatimonadaceae bacterium]